MLRCTLAKLRLEKAEYRLLFGMVMALRPVQPLNAPDPILVTRLGIVMLVRPVQPLNALDPMLVTLSGIVTLVSCGQLE